MERLTIAQPGGLYNIRPGYTWQAVAQRLAAYEDTGLEPEEIENTWAKYSMMKDAVTDYEGNLLVPLCRLRGLGKN